MGAVTRYGNVYDLLGMYTSSQKWIMHKDDEHNMLKHACISYNMLLLLVYVP